jgi:amidase
MSHEYTNAGVHYSCIRDLFVDGIGIPQKEASMPDHDLIFASARALAQAIRAKRVSSSEVVRACLERIAAVNPRLNAAVQVTAEAARAQGRAADAALARGEVWGPLHGVPVTVKDSLDTAGIISTGGTYGRRAYVPDQDATTVARLRAAGAILLAKTNTPELTLSIETDNLIYGRTNNPYDPALTPGGSSGGEAALIAAGGSPLGLGSDSGGSIRQPAHFCGIAGLKPTSGRVPRTGHILSFDVGAMESVTQIGPLARRVEDLGLALALIAGPDWRDPAIVPMPLGDPQAVALGELRVAFYTDNGVVPPTPATVGTVRAAAAALAPAVASLREDRPPEVERTTDLWMQVAVADGSAWIRRLLEQAGTTEIHPILTKRFLERQAISSAEFGRLLTRLDIVRSRMLAFMEAYDALVCPVNAYPAMPHAAVYEQGIGWSYTRIYNLTGWPAAVVRGGTSPEGLPIGVQVVARPWREDVALAVAGYLETALGGWQPPPY